MLKTSFSYLFNYWPLCCSSSCQSWPSTPHGYIRNRAAYLHIRALPPPHPFHAQHQHTPGTGDRTGLSYRTVHTTSFGLLSVNGRNRGRLAYQFCMVLGRVRRFSGILIRRQSGRSPPMSEQEDIHRQQSSNCTIIFSICDSLYGICIGST